MTDMDKELQMKRELIELQRQEVELMERKAACMRLLSAPAVHENIQSAKKQNLEVDFLLQYSQSRNESGNDSETVGTRFLYARYKEFVERMSEKPLPHAAFTNHVLSVYGVLRSAKSKKHHPATYFIDWAAVYKTLTSCTTEAT